jgi:hypothetical protein
MKVGAMHTLTNIVYFKGYLIFRDLNLFMAISAALASIYSNYLMLSIK